MFGGIADAADQPARPWAGSVLLVRDLLQAAGTLAARSDDIAASALFDVRLLARDRRPSLASAACPWRRTWR